MGQFRARNVRLILAPKEQLARGASELSDRPSARVRVLLLCRRRHFDHREPVNETDVRNAFRHHTLSGVFGRITILLFGAKSTIVLERTKGNGTDLRERPIGAGVGGAVAAPPRSDFIQICRSLSRAEWSQTRLGSVIDESAGKCDCYYVANVDSNIHYVDVA